VARDRDTRVIRATRIEAATRAEQRAEETFVGGEQGENQTSHGDQSSFVERRRALYQHRPDRSVHALQDEIGRRAAVQGDASHFKWLLRGVS